MNSESEVAVYRRALEEVARFGRVLNAGEREDIAYLEALWRIECRGDDPVLHASGEGDWGGRLGTGGAKNEDGPTEGAKRRTPGRPTGRTIGGEVEGMLENCHCGRTGEIGDREPVATSDGGGALRCSGCGHLDGLDRLPEEARRHVFEEAERRQTEAA